MEELSGTDNRRSSRLVAETTSRVFGVRDVSFDALQTGEFLFEQVPDVGFANKNGERQNTRERFDDIDGVSRRSQSPGSVSDEFGNPRDDFKDEQSKDNT